MDGRPQSMCIFAFREDSSKFTFEKKKKRGEDSRDYGHAPKDTTCDDLILREKQL